MKTKTTKIMGILLTLVMLVTMLGMFSITAYAAEAVVAWKDTDNDGVMDSGEATYTSLSKALSAGGTVKLAVDYTLGDNDAGEHYISMSSGTATLDLNGYTLTCASLIEFDIIVLGGTANLTITDSKTTGTINCTARNDVKLSDSSRLTIAGGIIRTSTVHTQYYLTIIKSGNAVFEITGGKHYSNPTAYIATNHKVVRGNTDPQYTVSAIETNEVVAWNDADNDGVIDSGERVFSDMDTALAAGVDLKMNSDIFRDSMHFPPGALKITSTKTVDLNGHSIIASAYCFEVNSGTLTIKDSAGGGQLWCQNDDRYAAISVYSGSDIGLIVESGTILGNIAHYGAHTYPDAVVLNGGNYSFDPSRYIKDSTLTAGQDSSGIWGIRPNAADACTVEIIGSYFYNGNAITPSIVVKDSANNVLTENVDYTVTLTNNVNAGNVGVTINFVNDYRGSISKGFVIQKATPTATDFSVSGSLMYNGKAQTATIASSFVNTNDISVKYYNASGDPVEAPIAGGVYTVKVDVAANTNYNAVTDLEIGTFEITRRALPNADVTVSEDVTYNGEEQAPTVTVAGLTLGTDYTLSWDKDGFISAGTYTATIKGIGNYQGTVNKSYVITPKAILDSDISIDITEAIYDGNAHIPVITVKDGEKNLLEETDYKISWNKNGFVNAGTYTATITGKGNYGGSFTRTFVIKQAALVIELTSPISSVLPGNQIALTLNTNSDAAPTWLITGGAHISGTKIKIADNLTIGEDKVTITVTCTETANVKGGSNTITLEVGMADFSGEIAELEADIAELNKLIAEGGDMDQINDKITAITNRVKALEDNGATDAELEKAKTDLTAAYTKAIEAVEKAIEELKAVDAADAQALSDAITTLNQAIENAKSFATDADSALEAKLNAKIDEADKALEEKASALEDKITEEVDKLQKQINTNNTDIKWINASITTINSLIDALKKADEALDGDITEAVTKAENELKTVQDELKALIGGVQSDLNTTKEKVDKAIADLKAADTALQNAIDNNSGNIASLTADLTDKYNALTALIGTLPEGVESMKDYVDGINAALDKADDTLQEAIDKVAKDLTDAEKELTDAITNGDNDLSDRISALNTALDNAISAYQASDDLLKAELTTKMDKADATLNAAIKTVQKNLDKAKSELKKAIKDGDAALEAKIADLNKALEAAKAASEKANADTKAELTAKIDEAYNALDAAVKALQGRLDDAKAELDDKDQALEAKTDELKTVLIIVAIISGVTLCGGAAFVIWFFCDRKKRA